MNKQEISNKQYYSETYHNVINIIFMAIGYISIIIFTIYDLGIANGLMCGFAVCVTGTLCFLLLPIAIFAVTLIIKYCGLIAIFYYIFSLIALLFGEDSFGNYFMLNSIIYISWFIFSLINMVTWKYCDKDNVIPTCLE